MIITVTMNPAIDKTVDVPELVCGGLNRITKVEYDAGGKGINVSKTIQELGGQSIATGFLGGNNGQVIAGVLKDKGIKCDFVWVSGETRTNTKVIEADGSLTELNEPGFLITQDHLQALKNKLLEYANEEAIFVFAGSIPAGVSKDIYGELIRLVKEKGAYTILDADGEAFRQSIDAGPDYIKPNDVELAEYFNLKADNAEIEESGDLKYDSNILQLVCAAKRFKEKGVKNTIVSMGKKGALFLFEDYQAKCPSLSVTAHSTVGAGDAMVAALSYAWDQKLSSEETIKLCMAVSAGAVTTIGTKPPSKEVVDTLLTQVMIQKI